MKRFLAVAVMLALCGTSHAAGDARREEIRQQRHALEVNYAKQQEECRRQFVVTPCLEKAQLEKIKASQALKTEENNLDEADRRARGEAQERRLMEKAEAAQQRASAALAASSPEKAKVQKTAKSPKVVEPRSPPTPLGGRQVDEAGKLEAFEARQKEIAARREAVEKRNAQRAQRKSAAPQPLPVPSGAASKPGG